MKKHFSRLILIVLGIASSVVVGQSLNLKAARELMPVLCQAGGSSFVEKTEKNPFLRCNPCPSFTTFAGDGDSLSLTNVIFAKPLRKSETLAIMDVSGCEPHVTNWGGTVLLRWLGLTNWEFVRYDAGRRTDDCLKFASRDGLDRLVCQTGYSNQGFSFQSIRLENFMPGKDGLELLMAGSNLGQCMDVKYYDFGIQNFLARDLNKDGWADVMVTVLERHFTAPKDWDCGNAIPWTGSKRHQLEFLFDGLRFTPTKRTAALVAYFKKF